MKYVNEGARCENCLHENKRDIRCRRCASKNGWPGWEPAAGVKVQVSRGWTITGHGETIETVFRKVVE